MDGVCFELGAAAIILEYQITLLPEVRHANTQRVGRVLLHNRMVMVVIPFLSTGVRI